jgi:NAD-dependent dihydropyrimidine dehydrogenase PreA subunit
MASGKRAARSIDLYLRDQNPSYNRIGSGSLLTEKREFNFEDPDERIEPNRQPIKARKGFQLIEETFSEEQALRESERCLSCGSPVACFDSCWYCLPCEESCPEQALTVKIPYKIR